MAVLGSAVCDENVLAVLLAVPVPALPGEVLRPGMLGMAQPAPGSGGGRGGEQMLGEDTALRQKRQVIQKKAGNRSE